MRFVDSRLKLIMLSLIAALISPIAAQTTNEVNYEEFPPAPMRPDELLREGVTRLSEFLTADLSRTPGEIREFLSHDIAPYFDFSYMARWAVGPLHRRMSEDQRAALTTHLRDLFLAALARNLGSYAQPPPSIEVSAPVRGRSDNEIAVFTKVKLSEGFTIRLEFRFYWSPDGWKIFDVAANGASAVGYYRRYYTDRLRRHGPDALLNNE